MIFTKKKYLALILLVFIAIQYKAQDSLKSELSWPREISLKGGVLTYYQPQIDSYTANILEGRSAISYKPEGEDMLFGAFWFRASLKTDKMARTASMDQIDILKLEFPNIDSTKIDAARDYIKSQIEEMQITLSLDRLKASLADSEQLQSMRDRIQNTPPEIYYREEPTILISVDGEPLWKVVKDKNLEYVQNSPFFIAKNSRDGVYYIKGGGHWYAKDETGWNVSNNVPKNIRQFASENAPKDQPKDKEKIEEIIPKVLVVYKPSELIVTDGEPDYKSIEGTSLLYVANTEDDIIMDINSQMHYVLLAGRWYKSKSLADGSWSFQEPDALPADFSKIPDSSDMATVLASVPGTDAAQSALLEQVIPQTATVNRKEATVEVKFDGTPRFKQIPNTEVSYSLNSDKSVLKIGQQYYCVNNGIWFISNYPQGPWEVSDHRPDEVDQIPPSEPVYNTRYVYVYGATPQVVYVGYLPGYLNSYVYNGVVVYGTGYNYPYWYGSVYYPRPFTYGYAVHYNPYTGWGFSMSFSYGWIGWGYHPYYRSYWGPCGYRAGYRNGYYNGYHHGYRDGYNRGVVQGYRAQTDNAYRNQRSGIKNTAGRNNLARRANDRSRPSSRPNNLYSDRNGNVYKRNESGEWDKMKNRNPNQIDKTRDIDRGQTREATDRTRQSETRARENQTRQNQTRQNQTRENPVRENPNRSRVENNRPNYERPQQRQENLNREYQMRQRGQSNFNRSYQQRSPQMNRSNMNRSRSSGGGNRRR